MNSLLRVTDIQSRNPDKLVLGSYNRVVVPVFIYISFYIFINTGVDLVAIVYIRFLENTLLI